MAAPETRKCANPLCRLPPMPLTDEYWPRLNKSADGFRSICKSCRHLQRREARDERALLLEADVLGLEEDARLLGLLPRRHPGQGLRLPLARLAPGEHPSPVLALEHRGHGDALQ